MAKKYPQALGALATLVLSVMSCLSHSETSCVIQDAAGTYNTQYGRMRCDVSKKKLKCCYGRNLSCDKRLLLTTSTRKSGFNGTWIESGQTGSAKFSVGKECSLGNGFWGNGRRTDSPWSVSLLQKMADNPSFAQSKVDKNSGISSAKSPDTSGFYFKVKGEECTRRVVVELMHQRKRATISKASPEAQAALAELAPAFIANCAQVEQLVVQYPGQGYESLTKANGWLTASARRSLAKAKQTFISEGKEARALEATYNQTESNDLADRGYYASAIQYSNSDLDVYYGLDQPRANPSALVWDLIFIHKVEASTRIFDPTSIDITEIQDVFDQINLTGVRWNNIKHFVQEFHHPADDRLAVAALGKVETPLAVTKVVAEDSRAFKPVIVDASVLSRHAGRQLASVRQTVEPVYSADQAILIFKGPADIYALDRYESTVDAPSEAYMIAEASLKKLATDSGYVYKNAEYWALNELSYRIADFFDGKRNAGLYVDSPILVFYLQAYMYAKSERCGSGFMPDAVTFRVTEETSIANGYGSIVSRQGEVKVDKRVAKYFYRYNDSREQVADRTLGENLNEILGLSSGGGPQDFFDKVQFYADLATVAQADIDKIFNLETCKSAVVVQLEENLYRAAEGRASIQEKRDKVPGALIVSDPLVSRKGRNLQRSCMAAEDYDSSEWDLCRCVSKAVVGHESRTGDSVPADYGEFMNLIAQARKTVGYGKRDSTSALYFDYEQCRAAQRAR